MSYPIKTKRRVTLGVAILCLALAFLLIGTAITINFIDLPYSPSVKTFKYTSTVKRVEKDEKGYAIYIEKYPDVKLIIESNLMTDKEMSLDNAVGETINFALQQTMSLDERYEIFGLSEQFLPYTACYATTDSLQIITEESYNNWKRSQTNEEILQYSIIAGVLLIASIYLFVLYKIYDKQYRKAFSGQTEEMGNK